MSRPDYVAATCNHGSRSATCPVCTLVIRTAQDEEFSDDLAWAEEVRRRTRWWKLSEWCPHWWRTLEPHVRRCRICGCTEFGTEAPDDSFARWLL